MDFNYNDILDGLTVAFVGYLIVFSALVLLYFVFFLIPRMIRYRRKLQLKWQGKQDLSPQPEIAGEVNAAISSAIFLYFDESHDEESNIITIRRVSKTYSPWSSKIYGIRNRFNRP